MKEGEKMPENKTKDYTRRAIDKYRENKEIISVTLDKGTKDRIKAITDEKPAAFIKRLFLAELARIENGGRSETVHTWETLQAQETKQREKERAEIEKAQAAPADHGELATAFMQKPITQTEEPHELTEDQKQAQAIIDEARKTAGLYEKYRT